MQGLKKKIKISFFLCYEVNQIDKSIVVFFLLLSAGPELILLSMLHGGFCIQAHSALESPQMMEKGLNKLKGLVIRAQSSHLHLQKIKNFSLYKFFTRGNQ